MNLLLMIIEYFIIAFINELVKSLYKKISFKPNKSTKRKTKKNNQGRQVTVLFIKISNFR